MPRAWEDPPEYRPEDPYGPGRVPQFALPRLTRATRWLLIANTAVYAASFVLYLASVRAWGWTAHWLGLRPATWREAFPLVPLWQPFTYGFLHSAPDIFHVLFNLLTLY